MDRQARGLSRRLEKPASPAGSWSFWRSKRTRILSVDFFDVLQNIIRELDMISRDISLKLVHVRRTDYRRRHERTRQRKGDSQLGNIEAVLLGNIDIRTHGWLRMNIVTPEATFRNGCA